MLFGDSTVDFNWLTAAYYLKVIRELGCLLCSITGTMAPVAIPDSESKATGSGGVTHGSVAP